MQKFKKISCRNELQVNSNVFESMKRCITSCKYYINLLLLTFEFILKILDVTYNKGRINVGNVIVVLVIKIKPFHAVVALPAATCMLFFM